MKRIFTQITGIVCHYLHYPLNIMYYSALVKRVRSTVISLSVGRSVCSRAYLWKRWIDLHEFFLQIPVTVALSSPGGFATNYVLPVLWMTSR